MTATTAEPAAGHANRVTFAEAVADTLVITRRNLLVWARMPSFLVVTLVQPVIFVLLFRFVFGGAIKVDNPGGYVDYLMPGIIAQTAASAAVGTAIALARVMTKGVVDRFRSMPMARSAFLGGRLGADAVRLLITLLVIVGIGYLIGFRFEAGFGAALGTIGIGFVFGMTVCCVSAFIGLAIRNEEAVQTVGLMWLFPLTFVSSAFVPVSSMPGWLRGFAHNQPVSVVIDAMRALTLGTPAGALVVRALLWAVGLTVLFAFLTVRVYRRG